MPFGKQYKLPAKPKNGLQPCCDPGRLLGEFGGDFGLVTRAVRDDRLANHCHHGSIVSSRLLVTSRMSPMHVHQLQIMSVFVKL